MALNILDYIGQTPYDPFGDVQRGVARAQALDAQRAQTQAYREELRQKVEAARAARERQAQYQAAVDAYGQNPTPQNMSALMAQFPEQAEALSKSWSVQDAGQRQQELALAGNIYAATLNGSPQLAADLLDKRIEADTAAGQKPDQMDIAVRDMLRSGDEGKIRQAQGILGFGVAAMAGPEKFAETFGKMRGEERAGDLHPSAVKEASAKATTAEVEAQFAPQVIQTDLRDKQSQIQYRSDQAKIGYGQLALNREQHEFEVDKAVEELLSKGTEVDPNSLKTMNEAVAASQESAGLADQTEDLADRFEVSDIRGKGGLSGIAEWGARVAGNQDLVSEIRTEYKRIRNSAVIKGLPPGVASDRDISIAMEGYPPVTAGKEHVVRFLRGMAKLQRLEANAKAAQADWISENGNLGKARRDLMVNGTRVPAGTSFAEFTKSGAAIRRGREQSPVVNTLLEKYGR